MLHAQLILAADKKTYDVLVTEAIRPGNPIRVGARLNLTNVVRVGFSKSTATPGPGTAILIVQGPDGVLEQYTFPCTWKEAAVLAAQIENAAPPRLSPDEQLALLAVTRAVPVPANGVAMTRKSNLPSALPHAMTARPKSKTARRGGQGRGPRKEEFRPPVVAVPAKPTPRRKSS